MSAWSSEAYLREVIAKSAGRADLLFHYTRESGYRLISCNGPAGILFNLPELSVNEPSLGWNVLPSALAQYISAALTGVGHDSIQTLPPWKSEEAPDKPFGVKLFFVSRPATDTASEQFWYLFCFRTNSPWSSDEQANLESRKLEDLGKLASGVAHDFNNLIMGIQSNAEALLTGSSLTGNERGAVVNIIRACTSGSTLTRSLLGYAKRQPLAISRFNLVDLVDDVARIAGLSLGTGDELRLSPELEPGGEPVMVNGCFSSLSHCLLNLIKNAREAMPDGGSIEIRWDPTPAMARLHVRDSGVGISEEHLVHICEPFYSTKKQGTGLGLAMVRGIMSQHQGKVEIASQPGEGTTVSLVWPRSLEKGASDDPDARRSTDRIIHPVRPVAAPNTKLAYVIDDDELVRDGVVGLLEYLGFAVEGFTCAEDALNAVTGQTIPKLILVDYHMPGMDGSEFIRQWHLLPEHYRDPETHILLVSGHPPSQFQDFVTQYAHLNLGVLQKPFSLETLRRKIVNVAAPRSLTMRIAPPSAAKKKSALVSLRPKVVAPAPTLKPRLVTRPRNTDSDQLHTEE